MESFIEARDGVQVGGIGRQCGCSRDELIGDLTDLLQKLWDVIDQDWPLEPVGDRERTHRPFPRSHDLIDVLAEKTGRTVGLPGGQRWSRIPDPGHKSLVGGSRVARGCPRTISANAEKSPSARKA